MIVALLAPSLAKFGQVDTVPVSENRWWAKFLKGAKFLGNSPPPGGGNIPRNFALLKAKFLGITPPPLEKGGDFPRGRISCGTGFHPG